MLIKPTKNWDEFENAHLMGFMLKVLGITARISDSDWVRNNNGPKMISEKITLAMNCISSIINWFPWSQTLFCTLIHTRAHCLSYKMYASQHQLDSTYTNLVLHECAQWVCQPDYSRSFHCTQWYCHSKSSKWSSMEF